MNKKDLIKKRSETYKKYHIPGCQAYYKRPKNGVYLSSANSIEHEMAKAKICYYILKYGLEIPSGETIKLDEIEKFKSNAPQTFITEAVSNETKKRPDIVILDTGQEIEVETDPKRAKRFENTKSVVIKLWEED